MLLPSRARLLSTLASPRIAWLFFLLLCVWAWSGIVEAYHFPDSREYLIWPDAARQSDAVTSLGPRMPAYPLLLRAVGTGPALVLLQTYLGLAAFAFLGWSLARAPGVLLLGLLSLAPSLRFWNGTVLTESTSHALLAFLLAAGLALGRRFSGSWMAAWSGALLVFALLRPANIPLLPFLAIPFVSCLHDLRQWRPPTAGLLPGWRRGVLALLFVALGCGVGLYFTEQTEAWRINYYSAMRRRVVKEPEALRYFRDAGLTTPIDLFEPGFSAWYKVHARSTYPRWVLGRPASYAEAWRALDRRDEASSLRKGYSKEWRKVLGQGAEGGLAAWLLRLTAPPPWLWLCVILAAPCVRWWRTRKLDFLTLWIPALGIATYLQCFITYHASGIEVTRHTLGASLLLRFSLLLALFALLEPFVAGRRDSREAERAARP
jgi:hypothetical protein